ncbi:hypothetical protein GCM10010885_18340 [Alicyclobacillus cellulosilyticus]|uniref:Uncharacterized protein n=1 Tax=Alicyclobacillus cellulosilyticus TaxID=1003997 RepID=A0A917KD16_9BACL|nr:hypothetical protein GCM10010885_18340 [Alicyclobacillus cellulosilyticus]
MLRFVRGEVCREDGASFLLALAVSLTAAMLTAGILTALQRAWQAVTYEQLQTQALYNARMGIDAAVELLKQDVTNAAFTSSGTAAQLASQVTSELQALQSPFYASVVYNTGPLQDAQGNSSIQLTILSTGTSEQAGVFGERHSVQVQMALILRLPAGGTGGGAGGGGSTVSGVTISSSGSLGANIGNLSVTGTGTVPVQYTGSGSGTVTVNGSSASVTGFSPPPQQITSSNKDPINGMAWISGNGVVQKGPINGSAIITGSNVQVTQPINGAAIVTGSNVTLDNVNGPALLMGNGITVNGNVQCALVTGNQVTIQGNVNGDLIVVGNQCTVQGQVNGSVLVTGSGLNITGGINGRSPYAILVLGSNEMVGGNINGNVIKNGNNLSYSRVNGTVSDYNGQSLSLGNTCFGDVTLVTSAAGSGNNGEVQVSFGDTSISG